MLRCKLLSIYYTLVYGYPDYFRGVFLSGHTFAYTGEVHIDHWHLECTRCGIMGASDISPLRQKGKKTLASKPVDKVLTPQ